MANPQLIGNVIFTGSMTASSVTNKGAFLGQLNPGSGATVSWSNVTLDLASVVITKSASNDATFSRDSNGQLVLRVNNPNNVLVIRNDDTAGFPAFAFQDSGGNEIGSNGFCNSGAPVFAGSFLCEVSDGSNAYSGLAPRWIFSQYTNYTGSGAVHHQPKLIFEQNGDIRFWPNYAVGPGTPIATFTAQSTSAVSFSFGLAGEIKLDSSSGTSVVNLSGTTPTVFGNSTLYLNASDANSSLTVRNGAGRANVSNAFGGTLAQGGGFQILTGGALGSQVARVIVADEQTNITNILSLVPQAAPGTPAEGMIWADSTAHRLMFRDNSATQTLAVLASPTFTGTPAAPTASGGTNTTQLATTAFVTAAVAAISFPAGANPTGTIGTTAVNGSAATFLRSDGAPAFDGTIARTWSALQTFTGPIQVGSTGANTSNIRHGVITLVAGTATVNVSSVTSNSRIFLTTEALGTITSPTSVSVTGRVPGTSFTITSANVIDTSVVAWLIIEP